MRSLRITLIARQALACAALAASVQSCLATPAQDTSPQTLARAREALTAALREPISAIKPTVIRGVYGLYTDGQTRGMPRAFINFHAESDYVGNTKTGYYSFRTSALGQNLPADRAQALYTDMVNSFDLATLPQLRFGNGTRKVLLFTAQDCPACRELDEVIARAAKQLDVTIYVVPTALDYSAKSTQEALRAVLCAADKSGAWMKYLKGQRLPSPAPNCTEDPDAYAFAKLAFPISVPVTIPLAITLDDKKSYPLVMRDFKTIFRR